MTNLMRDKVMSDKLRVLICEDDYLVSRGLKNSVESLGHKVVAIAKNGKEAVELALDHLPDLIFMDINMPIMSGLIAIKKINESISVPSIILTAYHDDSLIKKASEIGALYYLIKPVTNQEINAAISIVIARYNDLKKLKTELLNTKDKLESRRYIEKAKGIIMNKLDLSEEEAMVKLQKLSRDKNIKLIDISKQIINLYST